MDKVLSTVKIQPQFLLFSATIPAWVKEVAQQYLDPKYKFIDLCKDLKNKTSQTVAHLCINVPHRQRISTLADVLLCYGGLHSKTIVFCQTKADANAVILDEKVKDQVEVLHGDIAQNQREVTLRRFREGKFRTLVATDVAARGLDISNVDLVIQMEPPKDTESYIHRSGRTARAGKGGTCITFFNQKTSHLIGQIESRAGIRFKTVGVPQPKDIIEHSCADVVRALKSVDPGALPGFAKAADELIAEVGATEAVSMALAYISGQTKKLKVRSAVTGEEGKETIKMNCGTEVRSSSYALNQLDRITTPRVLDMLENVKLLADRSGVVFDLPTLEAARLMESYNTQKVRAGIKFALEQVQELPPVAHQRGDGDFRRGNKSSGGSGF